jgi:drug/metabolite transporter (DMT)-like permease
VSNTPLYCLAVLIWGSTWFAIEFQLGVVAPEISIIYRYAIAASMLFCWCWYRGLRLRFGTRAHRWFAMLGLFLFCLNYVFAYHAQVHITSALTAIVFATIVWMNIFLARALFGIRAGPKVLVGAALGVVGIVVLFAPRVGDFSLADSVLLGSGLAFLGALSASVGNMVSQKAQALRLPVLQSNAWGMFYGACFTAVIAAIGGQEYTFEWSASYVVSLAYLTIFGSVVAFGAYLTLLGRIGAHRAGYAVVMFPVVAILISVAFEGLELDASVVAGSVLVLVGNVFVLEGKPRMPRRPGTGKPASEATGE